MWNKCESCGKQIEAADDCRLSTNDGVVIHTYCFDCYTKKLEIDTNRQ